MAMPVTFSILTNMVKFLPIYFIPGTMGKIFKMIPLVVCVVFLVSLFESLFVLPAHLGHQKDRRRGPFVWLHHRQQAFSHWFRRSVRNVYGPFLVRVMRHRYVSLAFAAAILIVMLSYAGSGRMGFGVFPTIESDYSEATLVLPYGAPVERTEALMQRLLTGARQVHAESGHDELVQSITADIGISGGHTGRVRVQLAEHLADVVRRWKPSLVACEEILFRPPVGLAKEQVIADGDVGRVTVGQARSEGKVGLLWLRLPLEGPRPRGHRKGSHRILGILSRRINLLGGL